MKMISCLLAITSAFAPTAKGCSIGLATNVRMAVERYLDVIDDDGSTPQMQGEDVFAGIVSEGSHLVGIGSDSEQRFYAEVASSDPVYHSTVRICTATKCLYVSKRTNILTATGWRQAQSLHPGALLVTTTATHEPIATVEMLGKTHLLRIELTPPIAFFANGLIIQS